MGFPRQCRTAGQEFFQYAAKPKNMNNVDGATLGGPIKRNQLFFFFGWEGVRERQGATTIFTVPTADQRQGDFSAYNTLIYDPSTGAANGSGRMAFPGNIVPLNRQSATSRKIQDLIPLPNRPGVGSNFLEAVRNGWIKTTSIRRSTGIARRAAPYGESTRS